jgi:hypothetical protein
VIINTGTCIALNDCTEKTVSAVRCHEPCVLGSQFCWTHEKARQNSERALPVRIAEGCQLLGGKVGGL